MTVRELAARYGVSTTFLALALEQLGVIGATTETQVAPAIVEQFESTYGERIRASRPAPVEPSAARLDIRKPKPKLMRVAHERVGAGRDAEGNREKRVLTNPGLVHAIDMDGTWDGDQWSGRVVPGAVHFFGGAMNSGPRAACGRPHMRAVLGDEFLPADDPVGFGQCPTCAAVVAAGEGFRNPPGLYDPFCYAYLNVKIDGQIEVQNCSLSGQHRGLHRTRDGATWHVGFDDFVPAPLDAGSRITQAS